MDEQQEPGAPEPHQRGPSGRVGRVLSAEDLSGGELRAWLEFVGAECTQEVFAHARRGRDVIDEGQAAHYVERDRDARLRGGAGQTGKGRASTR